MASSFLSIKKCTVLTVLTCFGVMACSNMRTVDCSAMTGWSDGTIDQRPAGSCAGNGDYQDAYQYGATVAGYKARLSELLKQEEALRASGASDKEIGDVIRERLSVQRELDSINSVAAVNGWVPSQQMPEG